MKTEARGGGRSHQGLFVSAAQGCDCWFVLVGDQPELPKCPAAREGQGVPEGRATSEGPAWTTEN